MKRVAVVLLSFFLLLTALPALAASAERVTGKAYAVEVKSIDVVWNMSGTFKVVETFKTSGRRENVNFVAFAYDYEAEKTEAAGKFVEDQRVALVCVDGFEEALAEIADEEKVAVTVDGEPVQADEAADYAEYIGWQNVHSGSYGVVFPIFLSREGGQERHRIAVRAVLPDGREIEETAEIVLDLKNTRPNKETREATILKIAGERVEAYRVRDRIYLEYPDERYYWIDETAPSVEITFGDENLRPLEGVVWAAQTQCGKDDPGQAVLYMEEEGKLSHAKAVYAVRPDGGEARSTTIAFTLETEEAVYRTREFALIERKNIRQKDPAGIYFAEDCVTLGVGEAFAPTVLAACDGLPVRQGGTTGLRLEFAAGTQGNVVEVTEENVIIGVKAGCAYVAATYVTDEMLENDVGKVQCRAYRSPLLKVIVVEKPGQAEYCVTTRLLNVRAGAGTEFACIGRLRRGDKVRAIPADDGWLKLADGGYVCAKYLT